MQGSRRFGAEFSRSLLKRRYSDAPASRRVAAAMQACQPEGGVNEKVRRGFWDWIPVLSLIRTEHLVYQAAPREGKQRRNREYHGLRLALWRCRAGADTLRLSLVARPIPMTSRTNADQSRAPMGEVTTKLAQHACVTSAPAWCWPPRPGRNEPRHRHRHRLWTLCRWWLSPAM